MSCSLIFWYYEFWTVIKYMIKSKKGKRSGHYWSDRSVTHFLQDPVTVFHFLALASYLLRYNIETFYSNCSLRIAFPENCSSKVLSLTTHEMWKIIVRKTSCGNRTACSIPICLSDREVKKPIPYPIPKVLVAMLFLNEQVCEIL